MPTVRRVPTEALPGVRRSPQRIAQVEAPVLRVQAPPEAFGAGLGQTIAQVGEHFLGEYQQKAAEERAKATARANEVLVMGMLREETEWSQKEIVDKTQGPNRRQGLAAAGLPEEVLGGYDKFSDERASRLQNADQRAMYERAHVQNRLRLHGQVMEYTGLQVAKADDDETRASLQTYHNEAQLHAGDAAYVEEMIGKQHEIVVAHAAALGMGPKSTKNALETIRSNTQFDVIQNLLNQGKDLEASKRFKDVQSQLNAEDFAKLAPMIQRETRLGESQRQADILDNNGGVGMVEKGNIDPYNRPILDNVTGEVLPVGTDITGRKSYSTTSSFSFQDEVNGPEILIPSVVNGVRLGAKTLADIPADERKDIVDALVQRNRPATTENILQESSERAAIDHYHKTGEHLGKFKTPEQADAYAQALHNSQDSVIQGGPKDFTLKDKRKMAAQMEDPEIRRLTEERLDHTETLRRVDENEQQQAASRSAKAQMDQLELSIKNTMNRAARNLSFEQVIPLTTRDHLTEPVEKAMRAYWETITKKEEPKGDSRLFYSLFSIGTTPATRADFARFDLNEHVDQLSPSQMNKLMDLQGAIRKGEEEKANALTGDFRTVNQVIEDRLRATKLDPTIGIPAGDVEARKTAEAWVANLHDLVAKDIADFERSGKKPGPKDIQKFVDSHIIQGATGERSIWDRVRQNVEGEIGITRPPGASNAVRRPSMDVPADQPFSIQFNQIPPDEVRKIEEALARAGQPESEKIIIQMYLSKIRKGAPLVAK